MSYETIVYEVNEHIATITLNVPDKRNPLTAQLTTELMDAMQRADEDEDVRVMILTGAGKSFSAGGNLEEFKSNFTKPIPELHFDGRKSTELFKMGETLRTPLIASVNGAALGGGTGLVAMSHIAIASRTAKLGLTELKLGIVPYVILPWVRRAVGDRKAMEMMLSADILSADEAAERNLVHRVVEHEDLEKETWELAQKVASNSPLAASLALDAFYTTEQMDLQKSFDYLSTLRLVSFRSEDLKEGATAFLEKRKPEWKGK
ncbi:enoyl-CoA hydratase/isomerase family protein [Salicibibacter cibi]|uniref:Enoyl-CoA hydratase/isomerase family protein n=1 Tax=Salicibibacter cibi TaxID=2743001 RepID=A0A7T6Z829_9BACI|nr:enoyl-CoA hydratase/isomerase family protein [Salicibibacter cibi]QQK78688.1 enoyl-CoA hydratase/isomerase family protein [Salicibibacter cibi]